MATCPCATINFEDSTYPRKRECFTTMHNFFLTRPDGTTAAERFSGRSRARCLRRYWHRWSYRLRL